MTTPHTIITLKMTEEVIAQIGHPQDFEEVEISPDSVTIEEKVVPPPIPPQLQPVTKRLFRNPDNKLLGGVCSGIAAYLDIDTTWVRLATVALCFLSFSTAAVVYFILWIVVPQAVTPYEKLQMHGETPTFQNIGKQVTGMFKNTDSEYPFNNPYQPRGFGYTLSRIFATLAKVILIIIGIICVPVVVALFIGIVVMVIALVVSLIGLTPWVMPDYFPHDSFNLIMLTGIGVSLTIGIPLSVLIWLITGGSQKSMSKGWKRSLIIAWIVGFTLSVAGSVICKLTNAREKWNDAIENIQKHNIKKISIDEIDSDESEEIQTIDSVMVKPDTDKKVTIDDSITISKKGKKIVIRR